MKELREKAGLTTIDVAYHLKIAESTVRNWDTGRTSPRLPIEEIPQLLALYKCSLEELIVAIKKSKKTNLIR